MDSKANIINWFEISVTDIERATKFYETVFNIKLDQGEMMGMKMAAFPNDPGSGKVSGALVESTMHQASMDGAKIYFNGNPDLDDALSRVEAAGGKITMFKQKINDEVGHMAFFTDTENNQVALQSQH